MTDPIVNDPRVIALADEVPHPLVFATVSGAHLYGFASPDSDVDLRGCHVLPVRDVIGLDDPPETLEIGGVRGGLEVDLVSHDFRKFCRLLLRRNGYVLEQLHSPLIVRTSPAHAELCDLARRCVTRHHGHHYLGFAATQRKLLARHNPPRVKPLLYLYRVLLTGTHLVRTGEVEANLPRLNEVFRVPRVDDLIELKRGGAEKGTLPGDAGVHHRELDRLEAELKAAMSASTLPDLPQARDGVDDLLRRVRLGGAGDL